MCVRTFIDVHLLILLESLTSNRPGIRQSRQHVGRVCLGSVLASGLFRKGPLLSAVLFLVSKILEPFNNRQLYAAQTYHDERSCLGFAGDAVSA